MYFSSQISSRVHLGICGMQGLTVKEMEELRDDIKMHLDLDRATPTHIEYWEVSLLALVPYYSGVLDLARVFNELCIPCTSFCVSVFQVLQ